VGERSAAQPEPGAADRAAVEDAMPEPIARSNHGPIPHHGSWGGTGPTLDETKRAQQPNVKQAVDAVADVAMEELNDHVGEHMAESAAEKLGGAALERAATMAATVYLVAKLTQKALEIAVDAPASRGEELARSRDADAARYVIAAVVQSADSTLLPDGYLAAVHQRVVGTGPGATQFRNPAFQVAGNIAGQAANGDPEAIQFRDTMKRCVSEGLSFAHANDIRTPEALAERREHDPAFEERWEKDAGFQVGVRAAMWQAEHHPDQFDATSRERSELQMSLRTTRYA
jgi:hypothetical protein